MRDFTGFTFGDWHSTDSDTGEVKVLRVSSGDRYEEQLHPEVKDITAEVPGMDGNYYFGSNYGVQNFDIEIAFDHLTEEQFRELRRVFGTRQIKQLIFDERPYKYYMAKIESPIELSYVCFDEPKRTIGAERDGVRITSRTERLTSTITDVTEGLEVTIDVDTFQSIFSDIGDYTFTYENSIWYYDDSELVLSNYGIEVVFDEEEIEEDISFTIVNAIITDIVHERVTPFEYDYSNTERIYKGEGKITFVCYFPFAKSVYKELPYSYVLTKDEEVNTEKKYFSKNGADYMVVNPSGNENPKEEGWYERVTKEEVKDWAISSGILSIDEYEKIDKYNSETHKIKVYNAGDIETGFRLYLPSEVVTQNTTIDYSENGFSLTASLVLKAIELKEGDIGILIDTNSELIVGVSSIVDDLVITTGNLYNQYIDRGYFFHLKPNIMADNATIEILNGTANIKIFYDYLYF